jgi:hypothetical protein
MADPLPSFDDFTFNQDVATPLQTHAGLDVYLRMWIDGLVSRSDDRAINKWHPEADIQYSAGHDQVTVEFEDFYVVVGQACHTALLY